MPVIVVLIYTLVFLVTVLSNEDGFADFADLGSLLLGGFALAVVVAVALTFVKLRLREKRPPAAQFISISDFEKKE